MMRNFIHRSHSSTSSTVADPSTVTVRIECASNSDLNVQDVSSPSSSDNDDDDENSGSQRIKRSVNDDYYSSASSHIVQHQRSAITHNSRKKSPRRYGPRRLKTDQCSLGVPMTRPGTATSLPAKTSAFENEWDPDPSNVSELNCQKRNPSCPSISAISIRATSISQTSVSPISTSRQIPKGFTTSEYNDTEFRTKAPRDIERRSRSLAKESSFINDSTSLTTQLVSLTDSVLLGSIRALQNERLLCRLTVDYLIDASNMRPDEIARKSNIGTRLPCQCGHTHSRCILTLEFDQPHLSVPSSQTTPDLYHLNNSKIRELSRTQLGQLFSAVNRFISKAQHEAKRTLIYGFELMPNSPLAVIAIQYLMVTQQQQTLKDAIELVNNLFPLPSTKHQRYPIMDKRFLDYLKQLDRASIPKSFPVNAISIDGGSSSSGNEPQRLSRDTSSESYDLPSKRKNSSSTSWTTIPIPITRNNNSNQLYLTRSAWDN